MRAAGQRTKQARGDWGATHSHGACRAGAFWEEEGQNGEVTWWNGPNGPCGLPAAITLYRVLYMIFFECCAYFWQEHRGLNVEASCNFYSAKP